MAFTDIIALGGGYQGSIATHSSINMVQANNGAYYLFGRASDGTAVYTKSTDGGVTWGVPVQLGAEASVTSLAVTYDRWTSGLTTDLIHVAWLTTNVDDVVYRTIDTASSDALSTKTVAFAGTSTAAGGSLTIARARGGNVYIRGVIDAGAEGVFTRLLNADVPNGAWAARTINEALATLDMGILLPGWAADNQDMILIFWDASANEVSRQLYDDSANTWSETSIATGMVDAAATVAYPHFAACPDNANSQHLLVAWSNVDVANADLRFWEISETEITERTNVVLNGTGEQGMCAVALETNLNKIYVYYGGKSDGSETFRTSINVYRKTSVDAGVTWSAEELVSTLASDVVILFTTPRFVGIPIVGWQRDSFADDFIVNTVRDRGHRSMVMVG